MDAAQDAARRRRTTPSPPPSAPRSPASSRRRTRAPASTTAVTPPPVVSPRAVEKSFTITSTRTSGAKGNVKHALRLVGNDGTFTLPVSQPSAAARWHGRHPGQGQDLDAGCPLGDPRDRRPGHVRRRQAGPAHRRPRPGPQGADLRGVEDRARWSATSSRELFVTVPAGAKALQVNLGNYADGSQVRWIAYNPYGNHGRGDDVARVLHELQRRRRLQPHVAQLLQPAPGHLGAPGRGASHHADADQPVQAHRQRPGCRRQPGRPRPSPRRKVGVPTPVSWTVTNQLRSGHDRAARAGRSARPSPVARRSPTTSCRSSR